MFCYNCGTQLPDGTKFCSNCGTKIMSAVIKNEAVNEAPVQPVQPPVNEAPVSEQPQVVNVSVSTEEIGADARLSAEQPAYQPPIQPVYQAPSQQPNYAPYGASPVMPQPELSMKWHKFLVNFSLFAGAVYDLIYAIMYIFGLIYAMSGTDAETVYWYYDGLQALDIIYGISLIALAVFTVYVRFQLSGFKKDAPKKLNLMWIISVAGTLLYQMISSIIVYGFSAEGIGSLIVTIIGGAIGAAIWFATNGKYYKKRKHLFIN